MKFISRVLFSFLFLFHICEADLSEDFYSKSIVNPSILEKNSIILFTNARNENNIREWAAHHLLLGFDLVYIFDHKSEKPLIKEFENFDTRVIVERCEWENPVKIPLMARAAVIANELKASWMLYLDADEFLILNDYPDVKSMLDSFNYADSIGINWLMFGSNYHVNEPEGLILENYTASDLMLGQHVKTFVRPSEIVNVKNPHYYCIVNKNKMTTINREKITGFPWCNRWEVEYFKSPAYFAHYVYQSEETYIKRKVDLPRDDTGGFRNAIKNIHLYHNEVQNLDPKEKYASRVKMFLQSYD